MFRPKDTYPSCALEAAVALRRAILANPIGSGTATSLAAGGLGPIAPSDDIVASTSEFIRSGPSHIPPTINQAAEAAGLGLRSFQRELKYADLTYKELVQIIGEQACKRGLHRGTGSARARSRVVAIRAYGDIEARRRCPRISLAVFR